MKANGNWYGNRGTSATAAFRVEKSCLVCTTEVEKCVWPGIVGGQGLEIVKKKKKNVGLSIKILPYCDYQSLSQTKSCQKKR